MSHREIDTLRDREELYRTIVTEADDGIDLVDAETLCFVEVNDAGCRLLGYSRDELVGMPLAAVQANADAAQLRAGVVELRKTGSMRVESRHRRKDGSIIDVDLFVRIVRLHGREFLFSMWRDITRDKATKLALEHDAELHRVLIENSTDGIAIFNQDHRVIEANRRFAEMLGYSRDEVLRLHTWDIEAKMTEADIRTGFADLSQTHMIFETIHRRRDGTVYEAEVSASGARIGGRNVVITVTRDITERKAAERRLRENEERLRIALETAHQGWFDLNIPTGAIVVSPEYARLLGYQASEFSSDFDNWLAHVHPDDRPALMTAFREALATGKPIEHSYRRQMKSGDWLWMDSVGRVIEWDQDGKPLRMIGVHMDVDDRKRNQEDLEQYRWHLEQLVEERTAELSAAKEAAETANVAKSAFLANMSHEIRTPLNAITGMAHLIRRSGVTPQQGERLGKIEIAGRHLLEIINAILDLSKIEAGKFVLDNAEVRVETLVANVADMLQDKVRAKGLQLVLDVQAPAGVLWGDATRLQQALLNYASNAVKFTEHGSVTLRVRGEREDAESTLIRFEVEDTGIGIAAEIQPKLFSAFEQADNSISRKYGGTGLGLAITRKFAQVMNGEAGVTSTPGQGSTFWFSARLAKQAPAGETVPTAAVDSAEAQLREQHAGKRLLLAEDEMINREVALALLADAGLTVSVAEDGQRALDMARETRYDLILMDLQMPILSGIEATRAIRGLPDRQTVPILAMTANAFADDRARCLEAGMNDFIAKPVDPEVLFTTLLRWLDNAD